MVNDIIKGKNHGICIPSIYETSEPNYLSFWCNAYKSGSFKTPYNNGTFGKRWFKKVDQLKLQTSMIKFI